MINFGVRLRKLPALLLSAAVVLVGSQRAAGQAAVEYDYGSADCAESGFNGVESVLVAEGECAGGGFIAVGYTKQTGENGACGPSDVYLVRTNAAGARLWERRYEIVTTDAENDDDIGYSVKALANGFIIVGTTKEMNNVNNDVFLLRVDCQGNVMWGCVYGNQNAEDEAREVIVSGYAGQAPGSAIGDFVICGWTEDPQACAAPPFVAFPDVIFPKAPPPNRSWDPFLLRASAQGGFPIWHNVYRRCQTGPYGCNEFFMSLIEAKRPVQGGNAGDIVAVGGSWAYTARQGALAMRVNIDGGVIANNTAIYGGADENAVFTSVMEMTGDVESSNLLFAGAADFNSGMVNVHDIYVVKSAANPCSRLDEISIGDLNGGPRNQDIAFDIIERKAVFSAGGIGNHLDLFLTGKTNNAQIGTDAFLLHLNRATLVPLAPVGFTFGDDNGFNDIGYSLIDDGQRPNPLSTLTGGFAICGLNTAAPFGPLDPDLYFIKTSRFGTTACSNPWDPDYVDENWFQSCQTPCAIPVEQFYPSNPQKTDVDWDDVTCASTNFPRIGVTGEPGEAGLATAGARSIPNPVVSGREFSIEFMAMGQGDVEISVSDMIGRNVLRMTTRYSLRSVSIPTEGWPAGTYLVRLEGDGMNETIRVVVVE